MLEPGSHLDDCGVSKMKALEKGRHAGGVRRFSNARVIPLSGVVVEGRASQRQV